MNKIVIEEMTFFARHGFYPEENVIGGKFEVDLEFETVFSEKARENDDLVGTVNYENVYAIVKEEMAITSKLLEHVADRIVTRLYRELSEITFIRLKVSKLNPPMGGEIGRVSVILEK
ncbi:dihydroneopterin aldolase [Vicingaceae bacterium]|nr:dihydroneopterin aldolase [Vicingaceae bacterium]